jgi:hypothetical protein
MDDPTIIMYHDDDNTARKSALIESILAAKAHHTTHERLPPNSENSERLLENCIRDHQRHFKRNAAHNHSHPHKLLIFDDVLAHAVSGSKSMKLLFVNGRCMRMGCIIATTCPLTISQVITTNTDYVILVGAVSDDHLAGVYAAYALSHIVGSIEAFKAAMDNARCLIVVLGPSERRGVYSLSDGKLTDDEPNSPRTT